MQILMKPPQNERKYQKMKKRWYKAQKKVPKNEHYGYAEPNKPEQGIMFRLLGKLWTIIKTMALIIIFILIMNTLLNLFFPEVMKDIPGALDKVKEYFDTHTFYIRFF